MEAVEQAVEKLEVQEVRRLTQTRGWKILQDRLDKLSKQKETELAGLLRRCEFEKALYLRGCLDGLELTIGEANRLSQSRREEEHPNY